MIQQRVVRHVGIAAIVLGSLLAACGWAQAQTMYSTTATLTQVQGNVYRLQCWTWVPTLGFAENGVVQGQVPAGWTCSAESWPVIIKIKQPDGPRAPQITRIKHDLWIQIPYDKDYVTIFTRVGGEIKGKMRIPVP